MNQDSGKFQNYKPTENSRKQTTESVLYSIREKCNKLVHKLRIMHICGTHEATVARSGMRSVLPEIIEIIPGPGCPVCVCPADHITKANELSRAGKIIVTFGDMFKVPDANLKTLSQSKAEGNDVRVVYSVSDAVTIAEENLDKDIVWLGVGFETTAPMTSFILEAVPPSNFYVLSDFRLIPPALEYLCQFPDFDIDGFILPGHVTTVMGTVEYKEIAKKYEIPCVVGGFDPLGFLIAIDKLLDLIITGKSEVINAYPEVVKEGGNQLAKESMKNVFDFVDANWRGIGIIPQSGFILNEKYRKYDANILLNKTIPIGNDLSKGCLCGLVILGKTMPESCPHFLKRCTPDTAIGPCMVSDEGTCRIRAVYQEIKSE